MVSPARCLRLFFSRLQGSFGMLLIPLIPSWGPKGKVLWLCSCLSYFLPARSDEVLAADSGAVHSAHCLTRGDVTFYAGSTQLQHIRWRQFDRVEVRFKGHKGDQEQIGSVRVRIRTEVRGSKSSFRDCLLYTSPSPRDKRQSRMPSSA